MERLKAVYWLNNPPLDCRIAYKW